MTMVDMTFHRQYHNVILLADLGCELLEPGFKPIYQKELSPIAWAKHKVIIYHRNGCFCASVVSFHVSILSQFRQIYVTDI
jgi:hypothetical protein